MTEVVRGQVSDRPWGLTLAQFERRKVTGQLTLRAADGRQYEIAFDRGAVVGARSPQPADSVTRIALTEGLITSSQTAFLADRIAATPDKDEVHTIATVCRLDVTQTLRLRRRLLVQRAARTFSVDQGSFVVDDVLTIPVTNDVPVDLGEVIYQGARTNLTEHRLATDMRGFGSHFALAAEASQHAERFGFDAADRGVLDSLRDATTLAEIEAQHRELDPRRVQSMIYALVSCRECVATSPRPGARTTTQPVQPRAPTLPPATVRTSTTQAAMTRAPTTPPLPWRATPTPIALPGDDDDYELALRSTELPPEARATTRPIRPVAPPTPPPRMASSSVPPVARPSGTPRTPSHTVTPIGGTQTVKTPRIYTDEAGVARVRTGDRPASTPPATNSVARVPTTPPSNLREVSSTKPPPGARTSTPQNIPPRAVAEASPTPSDLAVPGPSSGKATEQVEEPGVAAARAYREAQVALSGDDLEVAIERLTKATLLNPRDFGYSAALAWAQLLVTPNDQRAKSAGKVRNLLNHAIQKSVESASLRLYLGWLERMLDHPREALQQFSSIREGESGYAEAQQAIEEIRQEGAASKKPGLAVLFRKKP